MSSPILDSGLTHYVNSKGNNLYNIPYLRFAILHIGKQMFLSALRYGVCSVIFTQEEGTWKQTKHILIQETNLLEFTEIKLEIQQCNKSNSMVVLGSPVQNSSLKFTIIMNLNASDENDLSKFLNTFYFTKDSNLLQQTKVLFRQFSLTKEIWGTFLKFLQPKKIFEKSNKIKCQNQISQLEYNTEIINNKIEYEPILNTKESKMQNDQTILSFPQDSQIKGHNKISQYEERNTKTTNEVNSNNNYTEDVSCEINNQNSEHEPELDQSSDISDPDSKKSFYEKITDGIKETAKKLTNIFTNDSKSKQNKHESSHVPLSSEVQMHAKQTKIFNNTTKNKAEKNIIAPERNPNIQTQNTYNDTADTTAKEEINDISQSSEGHMCAAEKNIIVTERKPNIYTQNTQNDTTDITGKEENENYTLEQTSITTHQDRRINHTKNLNKMVPQDSYSIREMQDKTKHKPEIIRDNKNYFVPEEHHSDDNNIKIPDNEIAKSTIISSIKNAIQNSMPKALSTIMAAKDDIKESKKNNQKQPDLKNHSSKIIKSRNKTQKDANAEKCIEEINEKSNSQSVKTKKSNKNLMALKNKQINNKNPKKVTKLDMIKSILILVVASMSVWITWTALKIIPGLPLSIKILCVSLSVILFLLIALHYCFGKKQIQPKDNQQVSMNNDGDEHSRKEQENQQISSNDKDQDPEEEHDQESSNYKNERGEHDQESSDDKSQNSCEDEENEEIENYAEKASQSAKTFIAGVTSAMKFGKAFVTKMRG